MNFLNKVIGIMPKEKEIKKNHQKTLHKDFNQHSQSALILCNTVIVNEYIKPSKMKTNMIGEENEEFILINSSGKKQIELYSLKMGTANQDFDILCQSTNNYSEDSPFEDCVEFNISEVNCELYDAQPLSRNEWIEMIKTGNFELINKNRLIISLRNGIEDELRASIWITLSRGRKLKDKFAKNLYEDLIRECSEEISLTISKDIYRTLLSKFHEDLESGKNKLYNLLRAYATYDKEIGYCQGMNYLAAIILLIIEDEEMSFFVFVSVMYNNKWRDIYKPQMTKLIMLLGNLEKYIKENLPDISQKFIENNMQVNGQFAHFYLTIFGYMISLNFTVRIIDLFFLENEVIIKRVLINILQLQRSKILNLQPHVFLK